MRFTTTILALLASTTQAEQNDAHRELSNNLQFNIKWDYKQKGLDWPKTYSGCSGNGQSPIDLSTKATQVSWEKDKFQKHFQNIDNVMFKWEKDRASPLIKVEAANVHKYAKQYMKSEYAKTLGAKSIKWDAKGIHFHTPAEHTIDGQTYDFDMQMVLSQNLPNANVKQTYLSVIFDTKNYDQTLKETQIATIDSFFENLNMNHTKWSANTTKNVAMEVPIAEFMLGELMSIVDAEDRWSYMGSESTPPCNGNVYWNVVRKVYPIKQEQLDNFKAILARHTGLKESGNRRAIQQINTHKPILMYNPNEQPEKKPIVNDFQQVLYDWFIILCIVWIVVGVLGLVILIVQQIQKSRKPKNVEEHQEQVDTQQSNSRNAD